MALPPSNCFPPLSTTEWIFIRARIIDMHEVCVMEEVDSMMLIILYAVYSPTLSQYAQSGPAHLIWAWQDRDPPSDRVISYHSMRGSATVTMVIDRVNIMETTSMFKVYTGKRMYVCYPMDQF